MMTHNSSDVIASTAQAATPAITFSSFFLAAKRHFLLPHFSWCRCSSSFYARKQLLLSARLSYRNSVCLSVCPSVRLSHEWISQKRRKLGSPNLHVGCLEDSSFRNRKALP